MTIQNWLKLKSVKMIKSYKIKFKSINVWIHSLDSCSGDTVENHLISGTWSCFSVFNGIRSLVYHVLSSYHHTIKSPITKISTVLQKLI